MNPLTINHRRTPDLAEDVADARGRRDLAPLEPGAAWRVGRRSEGASMAGALPWTAGAADGGRRRSGQGAG